MNCIDFQKNIDDYCSGELDVELTGEYDSHFATCSACAKGVEDYKSLLVSIKSMPVVGPSEGFSERAIRMAVNQKGDSQHRRGFLVGFGSAAVAALALWVVVGVLPQQIPLPVADNNGSVEMAKLDTNIATSIPEFSIALNEQRDIKLSFYSSGELKGAQITLQIPENVALVGYPGRRELAWKTNLIKGDNFLRIPIVATGATGGQLVAQIGYRGKVKTLKVNLAIGARGISGSAGSTLRIG
jgi:hypothetical protein